MSKMNTVRHFQVQPVIHYGIGAISKIGEGDFEKVCIVTDEGMVKFGLLKMLTDVLDEKGIHYLAVLAMPDSSLSYQVKIVVSYQGKLEILSV